MHGCVSRCAGAGKKVKNNIARFTHERYEIGDNFLVLWEREDSLSYKILYFKSC